MSALGSSTPAEPSMPLERPFPVPSALKLDANECGPSLVSTMIGGGIDLSRYPDRTELESVLAARAGVDADRIVATAGADDAIDRTFGLVLEPGSTVVVTEPSFPMFERFATERGATVRRVPWTSGPLPVADLVEAAEGAAAIVIATPNNPTGAVASAGAIAALRATAPDPILVLDLAYAEFDALETDGVAEPSLASWCRWMPRTMLLRTLSKAWGLASLRVGWIETDAETASAIRDRGGPYPISGFSLRIATEALRDPEADEAMRDRVERVSGLRRRLVRELEGMGIETEPSRANFVLARPGVDGSTADRLRTGLRGLGVAVRGFDRPVMADRLRITVPTEASALEELVVAMRTVRRPDGILLDLDGVIADVSDSYRTAILRTAVSFGTIIDSADIEAIKAAGDANDDWTVTARLLRAAGVEADFDEVVRRFQRLYLGTDDQPGLRERERSLMRTSSLLEALAGVPVGVVTGRPRSEAEWFLGRCGLDRRVDVLVAREDAPLKPDPRGIERAMDRLGIRTAWFLGDTEDDVLAARRVSGRRVLPIGVIPPGSIDPDGLRDRLLDAGAGWVVRAGLECVELLEEARS